MSNGNKISPHETFELHELITFKGVCATKCASLTGMVHDEELKTMMKQDLIAAQNQIKELESLIMLSDYAAK